MTAPCRRHGNRTRTGLPPLHGQAHVFDHLAVAQLHGERRLRTNSASLAESRARGTAGGGRSGRGKPGLDAEVARVIDRGLRGDP